MENTMRFELSSRQIKIREILKKEFLELEIYAISDINPNRNMTHFTLESMQNALPNFKNKPIVASFTNGDFGSHDGKVSLDKELDNEYWNVENGERILGWIRESDPVEIVEEDGLHWIKFRCALCVTYCYNQVKKLLKDRSKKVSVEITVHQAQEIDGIEEIYDFTLNGVTILGTKNGKPVVEAIPNAHVSILDKLDSEVFDEQRRVLSFAYQKMDGDNANKSLKEVSTSVENQEQVNFEAEEICPICGEPLVEGKCAKCEAGEEKCEEKCEADPAPAEERCEADPAPEAEEKCEEKCEADPAPEDENCSTGEEAQQEENCEAPEGCECNSENCECNSENCEAPEGCEQNAADPEPDPDDDGEDDNDDDHDEEDCRLSLEAVKCELEKCKAELCAANEKYTALETENTELKTKLEQYADYDAIKTRMEAAELKLHEQFCADLKVKAMTLMSGEIISDEDRTAIETKCAEGKYSCEEDIKKDVAYAIYSARPAKQTETERYSAGIVAPTIVENDTKKKDLNTMSREERIAERNKRGSKKN